MVTPIGQILMSSCGLTQDALDEALRVQERKGGRIGEILTAQKAVTETDVLEALGAQFKLPVMHALPPVDGRAGFTDKVPIQFLKTYRMVPVDTPEGPGIAVNDPLQFEPLDDLRRLLGPDATRVCLAPLAAINTAINTAYDMGGDSAERVIQGMEDEDSDRLLSEIRRTGDLLDDTSAAPVIKLVNLMLSQAVRDGASDIHVEPYQDQLKVRYRVDGILYNMLFPPKNAQDALVSRIKIMANLNIAEKRLPQDGRIDIRIGDKQVDIRVATLPTAFGERVVLRLLDKSQALRRLPDLGMDRDALTAFDRLIHLSHGIILVTGPTGSGKTTTLYAVLGTINHPDINIITIEDPVEYQMDGIGQIQVNPRIGLTFAGGLRSIVRQDPDVILVGEIRDRETAEIAIHSALTGHLVFSTIHTNNSAGAVTRLIDMGIEPYLVSSSVVGILAQRLVRTLCPECREAYAPDAASLKEPGIPADAFSDGEIFRGRGCGACLQTGYRGRAGIFELMVMDDPLKALLLKTADANAIESEAAARGMTTLLQNGLARVRAGKTTLEEVFRVTQV
ncbi:MAG: type II secretion system ATPase GspE [Deltaproteobacteria bacterium]|nr:type II secretion system ATPase GspE [Deltaproteobacteria bacterium]